MQKQLNIILGLYFIEIYLTRCIHLLTTLAKIIGDVAQLARVLDWQSRGRGFESHLLHKIKKPLKLSGFFGCVACC